MLTAEREAEIRERIAEAERPGFVSVLGRGAFSHYEVRELLAEVDRLRGLLEKARVSRPEPGAEE